MKIRVWKQTDKDEKEFVLRRAELDISRYIETAQKVSEDVRIRKDAAVIEYTKKFDGVQLTPDTLKVSQSEIDEGYNRLDADTRSAIEYAAKNIRNFHQKQMPEEMWFTEVDKGLMVGEKTTPIVDVCLYVPRGKGSFPSVLLMLAIPAVVAGVEKIRVTTPPNSQGGLTIPCLPRLK
jgi:histidinol dehydrogenase